MKKIICIFLILVMCLSTASAATINIPNVLEHPGDHRPVPTEFEKSKDYDDLYYFPMAVDPDKTFESLTGGKVILENEDLFYEGATVEGGKTYGKVETVSVEGMHFDKALRFTTTEVPGKHSAFNYRIYPDDFDAFKDYQDGEMCLAKFYVRNIEGGNFDTKTNRIYAYFCEKSFQAPNHRETYKIVDFDNNWRAAYVPVKLNHEYGKAGYIFSLNPIYYTGIVEVGGFELINYGIGRYDYEDMPVMLGYYQGCEEDAQWRKDAMERIDQIRKGDVNITVKDKDGNAVPNAKINVDMYEHEFDFSVAVGQQIAKMPKYREAVVQNFNHLGTEGGFHRQTVNDDENIQYDYNDAYIKFAKNNGVTHGVHGHALLWDANIPQFWMKPYEPVYQDKDALMADIRKHFEYMAARYGDDVTVWDVTNEDGSRVDGPTCTFKNLYGKEILIDFYDWARELFPNATLMLTDGGHEINKEFSDWAIETLKPDMLGCQGHAGPAFIPEKTIASLYRTYEKYGLEMKITEFDTSGVTDDVNYQGNVARDALIAYFSVPYVNMIQLWGFWNSSSTDLQWRFMYYNDWTLKPGGLAYQDLVYNKWWTREEGTTDANGKYALRAFYGDYDIKINANGKDYLISLPLYKDSINDVEIVLDETNAIAYIKNSDTKYTIVTTSDKNTDNEALVIAEYKDGTLIGCSPSAGEAIINRNEFLSAQYEKKDASSEICVIISGEQVDVNTIR